MGKLRDEAGNFTFSFCSEENCSSRTAARGRFYFFWTLSVATLLTLLKSPLIGKGIFLCQSLLKNHCTSVLQINKEHYKQTKMVIIEQLSNLMGF